MSVKGLGWGLLGLLALTEGCVSFERHAGGEALPTIVVMDQATPKSATGHLPIPAVAEVLPPS